MFDPQQTVRAHIRSMPAYEPILPFEVLSHNLGIAIKQIIKLDANENPYGPHPAVGQALADLTFAHIYPDPESRALRRKLSARLGIPAENLLAGAGADELIDLIMRVFIEPGDAILNCPPTFGMYSFDGDINRANVINAPRLSDFSIDIQAVEQAVQKNRPKLLFLASPNNPDGSLISDEIWRRLADLPVMIVLDEAYIEFAQNGSSRIQEAVHRPNVAILRTFSKWAGLAGLRVGYGAFPSALMPYLWKAKQPYNVSVAASVAAITSLENAASLEEVGNWIQRERERLFVHLQNIPWLSPYPTQSNFILCRVIGREARTVKEMLAKQGILIRYFNKPGLEDHIRISVGRPEHTDQLIAVLRGME
jgi:histidinol-phosphate aminotransferase